MKCGIVRGLWGDVLHQRHVYGRPPFGYYSILGEAKESVDAGEQTDLCVCFGKQNYEFGRWLQLPCVLMGGDAYPIARRQELRKPRLHGMLVWGANHFYAKWLVFERAMQDFDAVIQVDWDLQQTRPVDASFWDRQADGAEFRAMLAFQPNFTWGAYWRRFRRRRTVPQAEGNYGSQHMPYMGCTYLRSREFVAQCKARHQQFPPLMSQQVAAMILDAPDSRWMGIDEYKRRGHMADFLALKNGLEQPANARHIHWQNLRPRRRKR